ncbi:MAG: carboxypeptidase family protein [Herminiimonas sp.]|nr:carboxypeptidase family protein [Herminiimonas sp.]
MALKISARFDGGAIDVVHADDPQQIDLRIRKDSHAEFLQWFYFRLQGARGTACNLRFLNAGVSSYPDGWKNYQAVASHDRRTWFRVPTTYDGQVLTISHTPDHDSVYYAYFEPYGWDRHLDLLGRAGRCAEVRILDLATTRDGRDLNAVMIGDRNALKKVWVIARQHPGETMAEWFAEGMIESLLDMADPVARCLRQQVVFYIVPNMNPDGAARGNLRTSATGANLNREWMAPSAQHSPEVLAVRSLMHETGCDLFLDVHGDEGLPYVFVAGSEMLEGFTDVQRVAQQDFVDYLKAVSPDFQTTYGYASSKYREEVLRLASKYVAHHFKCVSLTLEMPFKDNAALPDPKVGWNGARSAALGRSMLQAILHSLGSSRAGT